MAIEMVRIPSETPNISNTDDFVGLRYAYGNQNGYVINKGQECSYTINGAKFRVNSGRLVLQGVECDIDANGVEITIDNVATKKYYTVYLQVNLATNETKILAMSDTSGYPTVESGDDLTQNTTGTATMELYHFEATSGVISNAKKIVKSIKYLGETEIASFKGDLGLNISSDRQNIPLTSTQHINNYQNIRAYFNVMSGVGDVDDCIGYVTDVIEIPFKDDFQFAKKFSTCALKVSGNTQEFIDQQAIVLIKIENRQLYMKQYIPENAVNTQQIRLLAITYNKQD